VVEPPKEQWAKRAAAAARRLNRHPKLVASGRQAREQTMGDDEFVEMLSTARGRPADLAARQLAASRAAEPGVLGELGLTAQARRRLLRRRRQYRRPLAEAAKPGEILVSDSTLAAIDPAAVSAKKRRFSAKGAPADLAAHVIKRP